MIDDTLKPEPGAQGPTMPRAVIRLSANVDGIMKHPITRSHAVKWVSNLRFLTFDDGEKDGLEKRSADFGAAKSQNDILRGQCQRCEDREPVPLGHQCAQHRGEKEWRKREVELYKYSNPCVHVYENSCKACQHIPLFPNDAKVTKFRIRRVDQSHDNAEVAPCNHFVAVSYCWSSEMGNILDSDRYQVVEEDGSVRKVRAHNGTIDRAVAFARENGFRMIWIDQECIKQDETLPESTVPSSGADDGVIEEESWTDKEIAIQSMDLVYSKSRRPIGLFQARLQQKHLDSLCAAFERADSKLPFRRTGRRPFALGGRFNIDAMHEAVSMMVNDKWNTRAWIFQEAVASNGRMTLLFPKEQKIQVAGFYLICHEASRSEIAIDFKAMQAIIQMYALKANRMQQLNAWDIRMGTIRRPMLEDTSTTGNTNKARLNAEDLQLFYPPLSTCDARFYLTSLSFFARERLTCSAAVAITYLQVRNLERVADKLAIVANICGYEFRLNTVVLEKTQSSLAACMLLLAVRNGDFSLLVPQIYKLPGADIAVFSCTSGNDSEFSWAHSLTQSLQNVRATEWNPQSPWSSSNVAMVVNVSRRGLSMPGNLWNMDRFVEFQQLQTIYAAGWLEMRMRNTDRPSLSSKRAIRDFTTHILFEILNQLKSRGEKQLANAILNSTSSWTWRNHDAELEHVVESVDEFPPGMRVENREGLFELDPSPDGWFQQCWIIDRVMLKGGFWTGTLDRTMKKGRNWAKINMSKLLGCEEWCRSHCGDYDADADHSREHTYKVYRSHKELMSHLQMYTAVLALGMYEMYTGEGKTEGRVPWDTPEAARYHLRIAPRAMSSLVVWLTTADNDDNNHQRRAIFDIDCSPGERVQVLTPLQPTTESIPRPEIRSMAMSWIVDGVRNTADEDCDETFRVVGMTKGMWEFNFLYSGHYTVL